MPGLALLLATGLAVLYIVIVAATAWSLAHPPRRTYAWSVARGRPGDPGELDEPAPFEAWTFRSRGRELPVWDVAGLREDGPVIICSHGWADSRLGALVRLPALRREASRVIAWDMPGHGEAPGVCALGAREIDDLLELIARAGGTRVVLYGWSLGAGLSIAAGARLGPNPSANTAPIAAVVAESPCIDPATPARAVIDAMGMPHRLTLPPALWILGLIFGVGPRWARGQGGASHPGYCGFDRAEHAAHLPCPLLVLHGEKDEICPVDHARRIAERAPHAELEIIADAGHNDLWKEPELAQRCEDAVAAFVKRAGRARVTTPAAPRPVPDAGGAGAET